MKKICEALSELPRHLYDAYDNAKERLFTQGQESGALAKSVIPWAAYSLRPTTIKSSNMR